MSPRAIRFVILLMIGAAAGALAARLMPPRYEAAVLLYAPDEDQQAMVQAGRPISRSHRLATWSELARSRAVLLPLLEPGALDPAGAAAALAGRISTSVVRGSALLRLSVVDAEPDRAARLADRVAASLIRESGRRAIGRLEVVDAALAPARPSRPIRWLWTSAGALLGLLLGFLPGRRTRRPRR